MWEGGEGATREPRRQAVRDPILLQFYHRDPGVRQYCLSGLVTPHCQVKGVA